MIFTCPMCSVELNVKRFPVECCQVAHNEDSAAIREGELARKKKTKAIAAGDLLSPCVFRSKESRRQWCDPCNKFLLIYDCEHFGCECTIGKTIDGARTCSGCPKKTPPPTPAVGITTAEKARVLDAIAGAIDQSFGRTPRTSTAAQDRA